MNIIVVVDKGAWCKTFLIRYPIFVESWKQGDDIMQTCKMFAGGNNESLITMCIELFTDSHFNPCHGFFLFFIFS